MIHEITIISILKTLFKYMLTIKVTRKIRNVFTRCFVEFGKQKVLHVNGLLRGVRARLYARHLNSGHETP